jgi:ubiquinone/menaquinone biosynthesis C-methylase UbiE
MQKEDITHLSFDDESFDVIICIHVMEHIVDHRTAMNELLRVLAKGGFAVIDVPIDASRRETYEDASITTPEARTRAFWQADHVRLYGQDFGEKLASVGFKVTADRYIQSLGGRRIRAHGLESKPIHFCTR